MSVLDVSEIKTKFIVAFDFNGVIDVPPSDGPWVYLAATQAVPEGLGLERPTEEWLREEYALNGKPWYGFILQLAAQEIGATGPTPEQSFKEWAENFVSTFAISDMRFANGAAKWFADFENRSEVAIVDDIPTSRNYYLTSEDGNWRFVSSKTFLDFLELVYQVNTAELYAKNGLPYVYPYMKEVLDALEERFGSDVSFVVVSTEQEGRISDTLRKSNIMQRFTKIFGGHSVKIEVLTALAELAQSRKGRLVFIDDQANGIGYGLKVVEAGLPITVLHSELGFHDHARVTQECGSRGWSPTISSDPAAYIDSISSSFTAEFSVGIN